MTKMSNIDKKYWIWFSRIQKLTIKQKEMLLNKMKTPQKIWESNELELKKVRELSEEEVKDVLDKKYRNNLEAYEKYMKENNIEIITIFDENYPDKLNNIYDKPILLFAKGNVDLLKEKMVAVVGCRECSEYGKNVAQKLSYNLAKSGVGIISGLARGIDMYAHIGAITAQGKTIAVIGNGLDNIYPYENQRLSERILSNNGLIITEYVIGTKPSKVNFPARNRIISGLADCIAVVEAKKKSGALITADFGLEYGKEIFAIPGNIDKSNSVGTNELIKQGANLLNSHQDILAVIK